MDRYKPADPPWQAGSPAHAARSLWCRHGTKIRIAARTNSAATDQEPCRVKNRTCKEHWDRGSQRTTNASRGEYRHTAHAAPRRKWATEGFGFVEESHAIDGRRSVRTDSGLSSYPPRVRRRSNERARPGRLAPHPGAVAVGRRRTCVHEDRWARRVPHRRYRGL